MNRAEEAATDCRVCGECISPDSTGHECYPAAWQQVARVRREWVAEQAAGCGCTACDDGQPGACWRNFCVECGDELGEDGDYGRRCPDCAGDGWTIEVVG